MNRSTQFATLLLALCALPVAAFGQEEEHGHFDIFVGRPESGDKTLIGGAEVPDELNLTTRVFEADLETDAIAGNNFYTTTEPGMFNAGNSLPGLLGASNPTGAVGLVAGEAPSVLNTPVVLAGATSDLFYWDGTGDVAFVDSPANLVITQTGGVAGSDGSFHDHSFLDIDDPASTALPSGGIYLAPLSLQLEGLAPSETAWVLLVTGEEFEGAVEAAEEYISGQLVPEPSSIALVLLAVAGGAAVLRR